MAPIRSRNAICGTGHHQWRSDPRGAPARSQQRIPALPAHHRSQRAAPPGCASGDGNYGTHKTPSIKAWFAPHPRFQVHFTPTSASWLNQVERWFAAFTKSTYGAARIGQHASSKMQSGILWTSITPILSRSSGASRPMRFWPVSSGFAYAHRRSWVECHEHQYQRNRRRHPSHSLPDPARSLPRVEGIRLGCAQSPLRKKASSATRSARRSRWSLPSKGYANRRGFSNSISSSRIGTGNNATNL